MTSASGAPTVRRDIGVDLPAEDVWPLVADADGWTQWLVDEADVDVQPGARGSVADGGERRDVRVDEVVPGRSVSWRWWPAGAPADASTVQLLVVPSGPRTIVRITETRAAAAQASLAATRWSVRSGLLARLAWRAPVLATV